MVDHKSCCEDLSEVTDEPSLFCSICLEMFEDPRILPCLHTFCLACLERLKEEDAQTKTDSPMESKVKCPQCRHIARLEEYYGVEGLPKNLLILRSLIKAKGERSVSRFNCESCSSNAQAVMYCETCADYLCQICVNNHRTMKVLRNHTVKALSKNPDDILLSRAMKVSSLCSKHPGQVMALYCPHCMVLVCSMCFVAEHSSHRRTTISSWSSAAEPRYCELKDAAEKFVLPDLKEPAEKVDAALKMNNKFLKWLKCIDDSQIAKEKKKVADAIEAHFDEEFAKLLDKKKQSLENLGKSVSTLAKQITIGKERVETANKELQQSLNFYNRFKEQVVECPQIIALQKLLHNNLDSVASHKNSSTEVMLSSCFSSKIDLDDSTGNASLVPGYVIITKTKPVEANLDDSKSTQSYTLEVTVDLSHLPCWIPVEVKDVSLYHSWRSKRYCYKNLIPSSFKLMRVKKPCTQIFQVTSDSDQCPTAVVIVSFRDFFGFVPPLKQSDYNIEAAVWKLPKREKIVT